MTLSFSQSKALSDVRFWILLFFVIRLFHIDQPLIDPQDWRQADGYSIARNFLEIEVDLFHPRVDHAGELTGIVGSEFPLLNYLAYLFYLSFGVQWWPGRFIPLIAASFGTYFFYRLSLDFTDRKTSLTATIILLVSIWFAYSRKFMPDVFSVSLMLAGIYQGRSYLKEGGKWYHLLGFSVLCGFGLLSKLPAFVAGAFLIPYLLDASIAKQKKLMILFTGIIAVIPAGWWYFVWVPHLTDTYGYTYIFMGNSFAESIGYLIDYLPQTLSKFYADSVHYIAFPFYLLGIIIAFKQKRRSLIILIIAAFILQFTFMLNSGEKFVILSYYMIPFVPVMSLFAAIGISMVSITWIQQIIVLAIVAEGLGNQMHHFRIPESDLYKLRLEEVADEFSSKYDLIAINNDINPSLLYLSHRKGWVLASQDSSNTDILNKIFKNGCELFIWNKHNAPKPSQLEHFTFESEDKDFAIFRSTETFTSSSETNLNLDEE